MKIKTLLTAISLAIFSTTAYGAETIGEKTEAKLRDAKREIKQEAHRIEEKICEKTDKNCFNKKVSNRAAEAKDYVKDKADAGINVVDGDEDRDDNDVSNNTSTNDNVKNRNKAFNKKNRN